LTANASSGAQYSHTASPASGPSSISSWPRTGRCSYTRTRVGFSSWGRGRTDAQSLALPVTGRMRLIRSLLVSRVLSGGKKNSASFHGVGAQDVLPHSPRRGWLPKLHCFLENNNLMKA
jgi:hypothetical protein